jgi:hypothetical protein
MSRPTPRVVWLVTALVLAPGAVYAWYMAWRLREILGPGDDDGIIAFTVMGAVTISVLTLVAARRGLGRRWW